MQAKSPAGAAPCGPPRAPAFATVPGTDYGPAFDDARDDSREPEAGAAATRAAPPIAGTFVPEEPEFLPSRRQDGWSADAQRRFLEAIAEGHGVEAATRLVGLSVTSAYAFRRTAKGATFALGWRAASLVAREAIAETLLVRALEGTVDTIIRGEVVVTRHRFDNRLALALLNRLDRQVESAPDADVKAARLVAQEFDAFLDLVGRGEGAARAGLFLARHCGTLAEGASSDVAADAHDLAPLYALAAADRFARTGIATAAEIDITDLDPAARAQWTAEQWARAEAAGLVALAAPPETAAAAPEEPESPEPRETAPAVQHSQYWELGESPEDVVRWCPVAQEWRTGFPPPPGFQGDEDGQYGEPDYERTLTPVEEAIVEQARDDAREDERAWERDERDAFFAGLAADRLDRAEQAREQPVERADQAGIPS